MTAVVMVKAGLSFACPRCKRMGHRAAPGSAVFTAPTGHEVVSGQPRAVRCYDGPAPFDWRLVFADAGESTTAERES